MAKPIKIICLVSGGILQEVRVSDEIADCVEMTLIDEDNIGVGDPDPRDDDPGLLVGTTAVF